jgi:broad specificity phosphatase PhoE
MPQIEPRMGTVTQVARIYLVRHGEASEHWTDAADPGLSVLGHEPARMVAGKLAPRTPGDCLEASAAESLLKDYRSTCQAAVTELLCTVK